MLKTTSFELQERQSAPLALTSSEESLNSTSRCISPQKGVSYSKSDSHVRSGYNSRKRASMSGHGHNVFVLDINGYPLTPTTNSKARRLMNGKQAKPVWNKFNQFGIQMIVTTRKDKPKAVLGIDFGTKFEGYTIVTGKENNLAVMWKLPDKKKLVRKLEERRRLRRARRFRNCRRRECRFNNREKKGFIAPSQKQIIYSRLKCMNEFFKCYPINEVAIEDVRFNHRDNEYGKNFSTIEVGKKKIFDWVRIRASLQLYSGYDTPKLREEYSYKKSSKKDAEIFESHCSDALSLATDLTTKNHIDYGNLIIVDDTYRPVRRRLHDTQFAKGSVRRRYSSGNFKGIQKGAICELGVMAGGTKKYAFIYNWNNKRVGKSLDKIKWLSHHFKTKNGGFQNYRIKKHRRKEI